MMFYSQFFKLFAVRKATQLLRPPLPRVEVLNLPKNSILHYTTTSPLDVGPASDDFLFRNISRPIMMGHIVAAGDTKGSPRLLTVATDPLIRDYHQKNKRFRRMVSLEVSGKDPNTLVVYNYGVIPHRYRYIRSFYSEYYKWWNTQASVWKNIGGISAHTDRQHFIVCQLPKILPSVQDLNMATLGMSQKSVKVFNTPESLMILELWKWFGPQREESVIANVPERYLDRVNILYQESGRWFCMNLGMINSWRHASKAEMRADEEAKRVDPNAETTINTKGIEPGVLQKQYLRMMMSLFEVRTVPAPVETEIEEEAAKATKDDTASEIIKQSSVLPTIDEKTGSFVINTVPAEMPEEVEPVDAFVNEPDDTAESISHDAEFLAELEADLNELDTISANHIGPMNDEGESIPAPVIIETGTLVDGVMRVCDRFADDGLLSAAEYRRFTNLASAYQRIVSPDGVNTLDKFIDIKKEDLLIPESKTIPDIPTVYDKSMLKSSLHTFDEHYIKKVMHKDVAGMVLNIQHAGIAVTGYETEKIDDINGSSITHTVRIVPVEGVASTLRFSLPVVEDDGTYRANGTKYRMRKQRGDLPIRKIAPNRVALTSYYGKVFVSRNSKRVNDYSQWLCNAVMAKGLDNGDITVTNLHPANVFDNSFKSPKLYSALSMNFKELTLTALAYPRNVGHQSFNVSLDHTKREFLYGREAMSTYEKDGSLIMGHNDSGMFLVVDKNSTLYVGSNGVLIDYGDIEQILGLDYAAAPIDFAELKVLGKPIPIGVIFGYELGLERLMKLLGVTPRRVQAGSRVELESHEYSLVFSDETLVFSRDDYKASIVLAGFNEYAKLIRSFSVYEFDKKGVYLNVLERNGIGARYLRELDTMYQLFVDPITKDLLIEMKEPTNFHGLLRRSCEMLLNDQHPDELDPAYMRIKGYERMPGAVYTELVKAIRSHNGRLGKAKQPIDLNPFAVWRNIAEDPAKGMVSDINPIENLKQQEAVTFAGHGGRNSRSMTKKTRAYHENDMGTMSESTSDSGDVAINTYLSADPQFTSLRGISRRYVYGKTGATSLLSTSALLSAGADQDDPKRVNFIGIQHSHGVACDGYGPSPVRTGYEQVIAHRTSDLFAMTAKKPGKVVSISATGIVVQYDDGEKKGYEIGRRYGDAAGLVIPHNVVADVREGQKIKEGDLICHNDGFFEKDLLNPNGVVWKAGVMVKTALMESTITLEDSSAISKRVAELLKTKTTKVKHITVSFDQSIRKLVQVGAKVDSESILCIIEDAITANAGAFDEESLDTLRVLSAQTPQAKAKGVVERIEVFYHGDKEDMSESLRAIANASDVQMSKRYVGMGRKPYTGQVGMGYRVAGDPLLVDTADIKVYITGDVPAGVGDKGVFCNQMKTVFGEIMTSEITTESGKVVDGIFGAKSIADRIVNSPDIIGTTATLLDVIGKQAFALYKK